MAKEEKLNKDINLTDFDDSKGWSLKGLEFGLWLSENRKNFRKLFIIALITVSAILFGYSAYNYFIYFKYGNPNAPVNSTPLSPRQLVSDLQISPLQIFSGSTSSDLAVKINNPNDKFSAFFKYCFQQANQDLNCGQGYIMPSEEKYIMDLSQTLGAAPGSLSFNISNISWQRLDAHTIPDWAPYAADRLNFLITNLNFTPAQNNNLSQKIGLNTLVFTIKNQSPYSYVEAPLNLLFFSGGTLVGVNRYYLENFLTGGQQDVKLVWTGDLSTVDETKIQPDINLLDSSVYLPYQGGSAN